MLPNDNQVKVKMFQILTANGWF